MRKKVNRFLLALVSLVTIGVTACSQDEPMVEPVANQQEVIGEATTRADIKDYKMRISLLAYPQLGSEGGQTEVQLYSPKMYHLYYYVPGKDISQVVCNPLFIDKDNSTLVNFKIIHYNCPYTERKHTLHVTNSMGYDFYTTFNVSYDFSQMIPLIPFDTTVITIEILTSMD